MLAIQGYTIGGGILYIILSIGIGLWGQKKGLKFWMGFLVALLLTVLIGAIVIAFEKDKVTGRRGIVTWK